MCIYMHMVLYVKCDTSRLCREWIHSLELLHACGCEQKHNGCVCNGLCSPSLLISAFHRFGGKEYVCNGLPAFKLWVNPLPKVNASMHLPIQ